MVDVRLRSGESFLTTLHERILSFSDYLTELLSETSATDVAVRDAIRTFILYTGKLAEQARQVIVDEDDIVAVLEPLLTHLRKVEKVADQLFGRGHAIAVPRWLRSAADHEFRSMGLVNHKAVLLIGPPQNFETFIHDLRSWMFGIIDLVPVEPPAQTLAMVCLPYLEGTRALWQPVTMGHELAHLVENDQHVTEGLGVRGWIDRKHLESLNPDQLPTWFDSSLDPLQEAQGVLADWVREIICDLHAVRRFGPAAFSAISEFLVSIGATDNESATHPPGRFRMNCMSRLLGSELGIYVDSTEPWRQLQSSDLQRTGTELAIVLVGVIGEHFDEIEEAASGLSPQPYDWKNRQHIAAELSKNFIQFIPAIRLGRCGYVLDGDVLNAGWLSRTHHERQAERTERARILIMLDKLVTKALDDLDFITLWQEAQSAGDPSDEPYLPLKTRRVPRQGSAARGGTLSAEEIANRLTSSIADEGRAGLEPLIVTPIVSGAAQGAALDVRLSTKFITFRRSGTPSFNSLDPTQDPREMQELVEKDWAGQFILHPLEMVLAATLEYIAMPSDLTAQVITRSSYGRLGLLTATAVQVHPHFRGCLTLELVNLGQMPLSLTPGERIAQLVFSPVFPPASPPGQKYEFPTGPQFSRVREDSDIGRLVEMRRIRRGRSLA